MEQIDNLKELINQGDVDTAIKQLDQLLQDTSVEKEKDTLYYLRGNAYRKKADWKRALDNYQYAIELNPDSPAVQARKMVIDILNFYIDFEEGVTALDLFAGTGSISIELVSRGCDRVISVEKEPAHHSFICKIMKEVQTDKCLPIRGDVFKFIKNGREQFDFIFADPPYALKELETIPELIFQNNLLKEGGLLVLEHGKDNNFEENPHFIERRVYGSVNFSLFR